MSTNPPTEETPESDAPGRPPGFDLGVFATDVPDGGSEPAQQRIRRGTPGPLILGAVGGAVALIAILLVAGSDSNGGTVAVPLTLATTTTAAPTTSVAPATTVPVTTTVATTTTVSATTTTTVPLIEPLGSPIPIDDLTLGAFGIGSLTLGDPAEVVLARLAASLGQPDRGEGPLASTGELGTCSDDAITIYWWGPLAVVTRTTASGDIFYSYRLDGRDGGAEPPAAEMSTLSGLRIGDTIGRARNAYRGVFTIEVREHPTEGPSYEIREEGILLWGPATSLDDNGVIQGIFTADPCGGVLSG